MSANAILYDERNKRYEFDGFVIRTADIGRLIANALTRSEEEVAIWSRGRDREIICTVTANYLTEMLRYVGRHGWFWDCLENTSDHRFDYNKPTPGGHWGESQEMLVLARELFSRARRLRRTGNRSAARAHERQARYWKGEAQRRLMPGIS